MLIALSNLPCPGPPTRLAENLHEGQPISKGLSIVEARGDEPLTVLIDETVSPSEFDEREAIMKRVRLLKLGQDDYCTRPIYVTEFAACIEITFTCRTLSNYRSPF